MENPIKMDDLGGFTTPIFGSTPKGRPFWGQIRSFSGGFLPPKKVKSQVKQKKVGRALIGVRGTR